MSAYTHDINSSVSCAGCREDFIMFNIYTKQNGKYLCKQCYLLDQEKDILGPEGTKSSQKRLTREEPPKCVSLGQIQSASGRKMFPTPSKFSAEKKNRENLTLNQLYILTSSQFYISKKPVTCPFTHCQKSIAISSLDSHFYHDHKSVAFIHTSLDAKNGVELILGDINYNEITCIVFINILDENEKPMIITRTIDKNLRDSIIVGDPQLTTIRPALLVMAAKIATFPVTDDSEDDDNSVSAHSSINCSPVDKILVWIASNTLVNFSYTLCMSTTEGNIRLKYFGPMPTINEDYKKLCEDGRGLILSQYHIQGMTESGRKPLILEMMIHEGVSDSYSST